MFCVVRHSVVCHCVCVVQSAIVHVFRTKCHLQHTWSPCALAVTNWKSIPCSTFQRVGDIHGRGWQCKTSMVLLSARLLMNYVCLPTCARFMGVHAHVLHVIFRSALSLTLSVASVCLRSYYFPSQCVCAQGGRRYLNEKTI